MPKTTYQCALLIEMGTKKMNDELTILMAGLEADAPELLELRYAVARCAQVTRQILAASREMPA